MPRDVRHKTTYPFSVGTGRQPRADRPGPPAQNDLIRVLQLMEAEFYRVKGFYTAGDQGLSAFLGQMMQPSIDRAVSGQLFRVRVEDPFSQAREWMSGQGLEILSPASGEFLIGDVPALTMRYDRSQVSWAASPSAMRIP